MKRVSAGRWLQGMTVALLLAGPAFAQADANKVEVKCKFVQGQTTYFQQLVEVEQIVEARGQSQSQGVRADAGTRFRTLEARQDGSARIEWTLLYVSLASESRLWPTVDTRDPGHEDPELLEAFKEMVNKPVVFEVDASGRLAGVTGFDSLSEQVHQSITERLEGIFSVNSLKQFPLFATSGAPGSAAIGAAWENLVEVEFPLAGQTAMRLRKERYRLAKVDAAGGQADIETEVSITLRESEMTKGVGLTMPRGHETGRITWDLGTGQPLRSASWRSVEMRAEVPEEVTIAQEINTTIRRITPAEMNLGPPAPLQRPQPTSTDRDAGE